jgi:transcriptional regulator with XRE-family HTH domain
MLPVGHDDLRHHKLAEMERAIAAAELAARSNLNESTVRNFEKGRATPSITNLITMHRALEEAGVLFDGDQPGARLMQRAAT